MMQVFIDFLKEHKTLDKWLLRYNQTFHFHNEDYNSFLARCSVEGNYTYMLAGAFDWNTSKDEYKFWNDLMRKWLIVIREQRERLEKKYFY